MLTQINTILTKLCLSHRDASEKHLREVGIHPGQAQVLSTLWQLDGQTQAEICRNLNITSATVNLHINKLKAKNFVNCRKCPTDKRFKRVFLTKKGREVQPLIEKRWNELEKILLKNFNDTEKILLMMVLEKMKDNLKDHFQT